MFDAYRPPDGVRDEMRGADGAVRPAWEPLARSVEELGRVELLRRWEQARRMMREGGVTFTVESDPRGLDRPWELDLIPHLISSEDWKLLEAALAQRARLLERIVGDLYGRQALVRSGLIPPALVFGQQGFLRPVHGMKPPGGRWLHLVAFDVARTERGEWVVLGDRTQTPTGAGYALENRAALIRLLPDSYHECRVRRMVPFFDALREAMIGLSAANRDNPRVALLSPGPEQASYFEQLFLGRHLGFPILEGSDLTVRDNRVYVKTLGGLLPVDVLMRRVDDHQCDPLELDYGSLHGVPGLVQAAHAGGVAVANALGTGVASSPALLPFLPTICRQSMGEDLLMPSAPTEWCGDVRVQRRAAEEFASLVVKEMPAGGRVRATHGAQLSDADRAALLARLRDTPAQFVVQEPVRVSTTPVWADGTLLPRRVVVRFFAVASGDGWMVMPGGLALTSPAWESNFVSLENATASKDTWVLSEEPVTAPSVLSPLTAPVRLARSGMDMPSRVADNLFWLGRYVERAEGYVRLLRSLCARLIDETHLEEDAEIDVLLRHLVAQNAIPVSLLRAREECRVEDFERGLVDFVCAPNQPANFRSLVANVRRALWLVRDRVSLDAWRFLSQLEARLPAPGAESGVDANAILAALDDLLMPLTAFSGLVGESMTRGPGWRFLDIGRRIERAHAGAGILRHALGRAHQRERSVIQLVLEVGDSGMTYRSRYLSSLQVHAALDLLLADESNPRSVAYQLASLSAHIRELVRGSTHAGMEPEEREITALHTRVRLADVAALAAVDREGAREPLAALLAELDKGLPALSDTLTRRYFSHSDPPRQRDDAEAEE